MMVVKFAMTITWHPGLHSTASVQSAEFDNLEDAQNSAAWAAAKMGYTPPKWWQYWRWHEGRDTPMIVARALPPNFPSPNPPG